MQLLPQALYPALHANEQEPPAPEHLPLPLPPAGGGQSASVQQVEAP
jgi:hypothetical protein